MMKNMILVINIGSTSSKIAVYSNLEERHMETIRHSQDELANFANIWQQKEFRKNLLINNLKKNDFYLNDFDVIACRGGNVKPIPSGIYLVDEDMIFDLSKEKYGSHPTNVGNIIAYELGKQANIPVITVDPPTVDELCIFARYSGIKEAPRVSSFHALNQKRIAKKISYDLGKRYIDLNLIVIHLGGGISIAAHEKGKVIDVNNALDGDGPFSPERAGTVPSRDLIRMCYSGQFSETEMFKKVNGNAGLISYLGTNSGLEVEERIKAGDKYAEQVFEAMAYHISKEIGAAATVLKGKVDGIVLTGSLAYSKRLTNWISERTAFISSIYLEPGENEMIALAESAMLYLTGEETIKIYKEYSVKYNDIEIGRYSYA